MRPGDVVLLRSVYRGRVRWTFPHRLVEDDGPTVALYCGPGAQGKWMRRDRAGAYLKRWVRGDDPFDKVWEWTHVLRLGRRDRPYSLDLFWDESWAFLCWYVNLQAPLVRSELGFDTTDWALDVVIDPDGSWQWKDEDDFAQAQELGVLDAHEAAAVRAEGERVVAERPWPTGWEDWRPPPEWTPPALPEGWNVV
jgi:hypothetical protein